jgi:hypothetical protein
MNKETLNPTPNRVLIMGVIATIIVVAFSAYFISIVAASAIATNTPSTTVTPEATPLYDPAQYGVTNSIGGYKVMAILTPQDVACMISGHKTIVLQTSEPSVHEYLESPKPITEIREYLSQIPGEGKTSWQIQIVGPGATLERILSTIESWNSVYSERPCRRLGGLQSSVPSP